MTKSRPRLQVWNPKKTLIKIHRDLFLIHTFIDPHFDEGSLTLFEKLVLTVEDKRFFDHPGVDLISTCRATAKAMIGRGKGGASTIDMQFVRTATGYRQKTFKRKLYEMFLAVLIQFRYSKKQILRSYLDCAFFGSGLHSASAASHKVFQNHPGRLNPYEASHLASMLVYPRPLLGSDSWRNKIERRGKYSLLRFDRLKKRFEKI